MDFINLDEYSTLSTGTEIRRIDPGDTSARSIVEQSDGRSGQEGAGADELRARLHGMWAAAAVAPGWAENADYADAAVAPVTENLLALSAPQPGERVLELACGAGGLGLGAAQRVGPDGEVVLSD